MRLPSVTRSLSLLILALIVFAACTQAGIAVNDPFARPSPGEGSTGGAFMSIVNNTNQPDRLISAQCPVAKVVELHETVNVDGVMSMQPRPAGFELPARSTLELKPGGKHVMLMGLTAPLKAGDTVEVTLNFEKAGAVKVQVPVNMP